MDTAYFDGACEPKNPGGTVGWGFVIHDESGSELASGNGAIKASPRLTNNVAEYGAAIKAVLGYQRLGRPGPLMLRGDSKLVVNQMIGAWRIKDGAYAKAAHKMRDLLETVEFEVIMEWVPREQNEEADRLSVEALEAVGIRRRDRVAGGTDVTEKQRALMARLGITEEPTDRRHASSLISAALDNE